MSDAEDIDSTYDRLDEAFPAPEAGEEVAGPVSEPPQEYVTSKQLEEGANEARDKAGDDARDRAGKEEGKGRKGRDLVPESLSSTIVFSVAVVAVVGAVIAIARKLRET